MKPQIELLAPAKDLRSGIAAIDSGADAVYIGAPRFGARVNAGNALEDIAALVSHAHLFWARVYVTVNTLLYDDELPEAMRLIQLLYDIGVDAVIIQDVGLLECDLPPIPLIASTQMHNHTPERVSFLEQVGIRRVILARELSLDQIRAIRAATSIDLESFIHGALCVGYSGQCYMSYAIGGRSGNRGECAQPCRRRYTLVDRDDRPIITDKYLLSLHDLNLTGNLDQMLDAGITSFKIEGRLKDQAYVTNVVSWYRRELDRVLAARGWLRSSSGHSSIEFESDVSKTFNRGFTTHFLHGRTESPGAIDSPKMMGEYLGKVTTKEGRAFVLETSVSLNNGDGLCWLDEEGELTGTVVNAAHTVRTEPGRLRVTVERPGAIQEGMEIYRNRDHAFLRQVERSLPVRKIEIDLRLEVTPEGFALHAEDTDGVRATQILEIEREAAQNPTKAEETTHKQLAKTGNTPYACNHVELAWDRPYFMPVAILNALRRETLDQLTQARADSRPRSEGAILRNKVPYPETTLTFRGNALNQRAVDFYKRHGVQEIAPAAESGVNMQGEIVMQTRYCIKHQLGLCDGTHKTGIVREPLALIDEDGHRYLLRFNCARCEMEIRY